ncbi:MAG: site-specific integrase [Pyrinomonadaceae bacterium]
MARTKTSRNPLGSVLKKKALKGGKKVTVWDARKRYTKLDGSPGEKFKRCDTEAEAYIELVNFKGEIERELSGIEADPKENEEPAHTLGELITYFRGEYVKPAVFSGNRKISGYKQDLNTVRRYLTEIETHFGSGTPLESISYEHCRRYATILAATPTQGKTLPAASTYHKKLSILSKLFTVAIQLQWLTIHPMEQGKPLIDRKAEKARMRVMTFEEELAILDHCHQDIVISRKLRGKPTDCRIKSNRHILRSYILFAVETGMRYGEIDALKWWQVDLDRNVIYLTEEAARDTKTGKEGILPITSRLRSEIDVVIDRTIRRGRNDRVLPRMRVDLVFRKVCKLAGVTDLQFRDLRATGATRMALAGVSESVVMKITRHTRLKTLLNHYTSVDIVNAQIVARKMDRFNRNQASKVKAKVNDKIKTPKVKP